MAGGRFDNGKGRRDDIDSREERSAAPLSGGPGVLDRRIQLFSPSRAPLNRSYSGVCTDEVRNSSEG